MAPQGKKPGSEYTTQQVRERPGGSRRVTDDTSGDRLARAGQRKSPVALPREPCAEQRERCVDRVLITGAAGTIGRILRQGLHGRVGALRLLDVAPLGAPQLGEQLVTADRKSVV